jgi:hypothetical protein
MSETEARDPRLKDLTDEELKNEIWKDVTEDNYSHLYQISNMGRFKNKTTGNVLADSIAGKYLVAKLHNKKLLNRYMVHRLVACAFVEDPEDDEKNDVVNHIDGNKFNNRASNLEWTTASKNAVHSREVLKQKKTFKSVICTDINGDEFEYESVLEAVKQTQTGHTRLKECLNGKRTDVDGLKWRYKNSDHARKDVDLKTMTPIEDFPGYYINEEGKIYGVTKHQYLAYNTSEAYPKIMFYKNAKPYCFYVHVLVAKTFIPNPQKLKVVNHIDGNKSNCHVSNLEWVTHSENNNKYVEMKRNLSVRNVQSQEVHGDGENSSVTV